MNWIKKIWAETRPDPRTVKEFGFLLSGFLFVVPLLIAGLKAFFGKTVFHYGFGWAALAVVLLALNLYWPGAIAFLYRAAMVIARGISWVVMRIVLASVFYFLMTPISLVVKFFGGDLLDEKINKNAVTYWRARPPKRLKTDYERLF